MDKTSNPTRADYMARRVSHEEYYRAVAKTAGISFKDSSAPIVERARQALAAGDKHLNTIPLKVWDGMGAALLSIDRAFRAHGDHDSLAGRVCVLKQAVADAVAAQAEGSRD